MNAKLFDERDTVYFVHVLHIDGEIEKNFIYMIIPNADDLTELHIYSYDPHRRVIRFLGIRFS